MFNWFRILWNKVSIIGIYEEMNPDLRMNITLTNQFAFTWIFLLVPYVILFCFFEVIGAILLSGMIVSHFIVLYLHSKKVFTITRIIESTLPQLIIFAMAVLFFPIHEKVRVSSLFMLNLAFLAIPFLVFSLKERLLVAISLAVSLFCYFSFVPVNSILHLEHTSELYKSKLFEMYNYTVAAGMITIGYIYIKRTALEYQVKVTNLLAESEKHKKIIIDQNEKLIKGIYYSEKIQEELKLKEEKFRNIFNFSTEGIFITDMSGHYLEINDLELKRIGKNKSEVIGHAIANIHFRDNIQMYDDLIIKLNEQKTHSFEMDIHYSADQKLPAEIKWSKIPYFNHEALLFVALDIRERKELQAQIMKAIFETEEKERKRIAQDLHDDLGALLSTVKMYINLLNRETNDAEQNQNIFKNTKDLLNQAIATTRTLAYNLLPNEMHHFGLITTMRSYVKRISVVTDIEIIFDADDSETSISKEEATALYRVLSELINNSIKHSSAQNIIINIHQNESLLRIHYADNGIGFDSNNRLIEGKGIGLRNIFSRLDGLNAKYSLKSHLNDGMEFNIELKADHKLF